MADAERESDLLNNSSAMEPMSVPYSRLSPNHSNYYVEPKASAANWYNECEELQKNLDPSILADNEFVSAVNCSPVPEEKDQNSSAMSFIELTT